MSTWISGKNLIERLSITDLQLLELVKIGLQPYTKAGERINLSIIQDGRSRLLAELVDVQGIMYRTKKLASLEENIDDLKKGLSDNNISSLIKYSIPKTEKAAVEVIEKALTALYDLEHVLRIVEVHDLEWLGIHVKGLKDIKPKKSSRVFNFYKNGDYWNIGEKGKTKHLKHLKGYEFIQFLIKNKDRAFTALEVFHLGSVPEELEYLSQIDYQEVIDESTGKEIMQYLNKKLNTESDQNERDDIREQIVELRKQLKVGNRSFKPKADKCRVNVYNQIKRAIETIHKEVPSLREILRLNNPKTIKTGNHFCYLQAHFNPSIQW
jgi:hypothetical protein